MSTRIRRLNDEGVARFRDWLIDGAPGDVPLALLENPETSEPLPNAILAGTGIFANRYLFGVYLNTLLAGLEAHVIASDRNFWTSLALLWFDQLCPPNANGMRQVDKEYRYILSSDYRHYYRHLVRSPWSLVRLHRENARLLLISPKEQKHPLSVHGEILEQIGGRQQVLGSRLIIEAASRLYFDATAGRPRTGVAGSLGGSVRRFGLVLRQLDLTYDPECMPDAGLLSVLPGEFDRWKKKPVKQVSEPEAQAAHS